MPLPVARHQVIVIMYRCNFIGLLHPVVSTKEVIDSVLRRHGLNGLYEQHERFDVNVASLHERTEIAVPESQSSRPEANVHTHVPITIRLKKRKRNTFQRKRRTRRKRAIDKIKVYNAEFDERIHRNLHPEEEKRILEEWE